nr:small subunit processome component 20 [Hymenolepis microstoma]
MRKIPTGKLFSLLYKLNQEQELITYNFCGAILAEVLNSPDGNFHSSSVEIFHVLFALITKTVLPEGLRSNQSLLEMQENDEIALFCKNILISSLQTLGNRKLNAEALFTICKLAFSYFSNTLDSRILILVSCCDELIGLMQSQHYLHQYEINIEKYLFESFSKHPKIQMAELIVKFVNLTSNNFNPSRLMSSVLIESEFTPAQQISLMQPMVRHRAFEKDFAQILSDVILQRDTNEPIDDATLTFLAKLVLIRQPPSPSIKPLSPLICLSLASGHYTPEVLQRIVNWIIEPLSDSGISVNRKLCSSIILPHLSPLLVDEVRPIITGEIQSNFSNLKELNSNTEDFTKSASYLCSLYEALFSCDESIAEVYIDVPFLQETALSKRYDNLELCAILLRIIEICGQKVELSELKADTIIPTLLSPSHTVRLHALRIMRSALPSLLSSDIKFEDISLVIAALDRCLEAENFKQSPTALRAFLLIILHMHCGRKDIFGSLWAAKISLYHLLGLLHVNLTPSWTGIIAAIGSYANPIFYSEAADSAIQPDAVPHNHGRNRKRRKSKGAVEASRERSRSPLPNANPIEAEDIAEKKSTELHESWKAECRQLFWNTLVEEGLITRHFSGEEKVDENEVATCDFDSLPIAQSFLNLLTVVPDNEAVSLTSICPGGLAPVKLSPRRLVDWKNYRLNLWKSITPKGVGNRIHQLVDLFMTFVNNEFYQSPSKGNEGVLICALELFSRIPNIRSVRKSNAFETTLLRLLTNKRPNVQQAAFACWLNFENSGLRPYKEYFEKILNMSSFRDAVRVFKLDSTVVAEHRAAVARVLIRILYGRLHLSKENLASAVFTNLAGCSDDELSLLLSLIVNSFFSALGISDQAQDDMSYAEIKRAARPNWSRLQAICDIVNQLLSYMGHRLGGIKRANIDCDNDEGKSLELLDAAAHTPTLFRIAILMISAACLCKETKDIQKEGGETQVKIPHSKQVKVVRKTGVSILLHLCSAPGINLDSFWTPERISCVQSEVLGTNPLTTDAVASPGHIVLRLASVWSQSGSQYLVGALFTPELLNSLIELLRRQNLSKPVAKLIVEIVANLVFSEDVRETGRRLLYPYHAGLIEYLYNRFLNLKSLSTSQARKMLKSNQSEWLQQEFKLLGYLTVPHEVPAAILSADQASRLLTGLIPFLVKALSRPSNFGSGYTLLYGAVAKRGRKAKDGLNTSTIERSKPPVSEAVLASTEITESEVLRVLCRLIETTSNVDQHLSKVLELFSTVDSRISRALLCSAAGAGAMRVANSIKPLTPVNGQLLGCLGNIYTLKSIQGERLFSTELFKTLQVIRNQHVDPSSVSPGAEFENCVVYKLLCMLNSWSKSHLDMVDATQRESALCALMELCNLPMENYTKEHRLNYFINLAGAHSALYSLQSAEIQLRDLALDYLIHLAEILAEGLKCKPDAENGLTKEEAYARKKSYTKLVNEIFVQAVWPGLVRGIKQSAGPRRLHFLRLLSGLVRTFGSAHPFFAPLALLADFSTSRDDDQNPTCFYINIQSGTSGRQLYAIRRLTLFLANPLTIASKKAISACTSGGEEEASTTKFPIPLSHLRGVFLPIILFFLRQEVMAEISGTGSLGQESRKLVSACLEAIRALASRLDWSPYRELLNSSLSNLELESFVALKYTLAILDAYQPKEEAVPYMLTVVTKLQNHIVPPQKMHNTSASKASFTYLRTNAVVALVTLLKRLPKGHLESRLHHLILKVIDLLRPAKKLPSHARREAVKALSKVAIMIGPGRALDGLFSSLARELSRGYTAMTIRLSALHNIFKDFVAAVDRGEVKAGGNLDNVCHVLMRLYLDEVAGQLAGEIDSRWEAFHKGSSTDATRSGKLPFRGDGVSQGVDLPEANGGPKAPEGIPALMRFCSPPMLRRIFKDLRTAAGLVASGRIISNESLQQGAEDSDSVKSDSKLIGFLRFRKRALARLQAVFDRIPTRHGFLHPKMTLEATTLGRIALDLFDINENSTPTAKIEQQQPGVKRGLAALYRPGWSKASTCLLEKKQDCRLVLPEPKLSTHNPHTTQTDKAHINMLAACGLHSIVGLIKQGRLAPATNQEDAQLLSDSIPATLNTLLTCNSLTVLAGAVRCVKIFMHLKLQKFDESLSQVAGALFGLVDKHAGLLTSRATAKDAAAQSFAHGLFVTLAALIQHQKSYNLTNLQLATLFSTIETEVVGNAPTSPVLSLLVAFLARRLRDPHAKDDDEANSLISFNSNDDFGVKDRVIDKGLVVSKVTDKDFSFAGAGGGQRLSNVMLRIQRLVILSTSEIVRRDCRRCLLAYLLNYPHQRRFVEAFIRFLLRQLEHQKETGRSSVAALLSMIISEIPQSALMQNGLEETILLAVCAAVERESSLSVRLSLYGLVRLLFTRIPADKAVAHFEQHFLAYLRAPIESRASARILGLQMVTVVLDAQECLATDKYRQMLLTILGNVIFPDTRVELAKLRLSHAHLFKHSVKQKSNKSHSVQPQNTTSGGNEEDDDGWLDAEELDVSQNLQSHLYVDDDEDFDEDDIFSDVEEDDQMPMNKSQDDDESNKESMEEDIDVDVELIKSEQISAETLEVVESRINILNPTETTTSTFAPAKSAPELHFAFISCGLELGLRLADRLLDGVEPSVITSTLCTPIWRALLKVERKKSTPREEVFATLLQTNEQDKDENISNRSALLAPVLSTREWAARVTNRLLRTELTNQGDLKAAPKFESAFFTKSKSIVTKLTAVLNDSLNQLERDSEQMSEDYSNAVLSNLICLGQFLNALGAVKQVLKIFRTANRLSLDELNNQKSSFSRRIIGLKVTVGLLLRLPRPSREEIVSLMSDKKRKRVDGANEDDVASSASASVLYLRSALRLLARESKQKERLAFIATASVALPEGGISTTQGTDGESSAMVRKIASRLDKADSKRAKARRRKAQAKIRRALFSGELTAHEAAQRLANISMVEVSAADNLINLIESTDTRLAKELMHGAAGGMSVLYAWSTRGLARKRENMKTHKAVRLAVGLKPTEETVKSTLQPPRKKMKMAHV